MRATSSGTAGALARKCAKPNNPLWTKILGKTFAPDGAFAGGAPALPKEVELSGSGTARYQTRLGDTRPPVLTRCAMRSGVERVNHIAIFLINYTALHLQSGR